MSCYIYALLTVCFTSLEPRLSVPDFVSLLRFFSKAARQNPERRAWVRGYVFTLLALLLSQSVSYYIFLHCVHVGHLLQLKYVL